MVDRAVDVVLALWMTHAGIMVPAERVARVKVLVLAFALTRALLMVHA